MKLTEDERARLVAACDQWGRHVSTMGDDGLPNLGALVNLARRVLAEQEERDGPEKPTMEEVRSCLDAIANSAVTEHDRERFLVADKILAAVAEFMRAETTFNLSGAKLHDTLSRFIQ